MNYKLKQGEKLIENTDKYIIIRDIEGISMLHYKFTPERLGEAIISAGIPKRYRTSDLNDKTDILRKLKKLNEGSGIILAGTYGCGKTYGLCAYLIQKIKDSEGRRKILYIKANELYGKLKENQSFTKKVKRIDTLGIDELGMEYESNTGYFHSLLDDIISYRFDEYLTTLIATNLNLEEFKERYSGRIIDRLKEWGGSFFESKEQSFRKSQK